MKKWFVLISVAVVIILTGFLGVNEYVASKAGISLVDIIVGLFSPDTPAELQAKKDLYNLAYREFKEKKYNEALADINKLIDIDPSFQHGLAYYLRGEIYLKLGKYTDAIKDYTMGLGTETGEVVAGPYWGRAEANFKKRAYSKAIMDYDMALEIDPGNAYMYLERGHAHRGVGNYDRAKRDYMKVKELDTAGELGKSAGEYLNNLPAVPIERRENMIMDQDITSRPDRKWDLE